jgi:hypothetical protein
MTLHFADCKVLERISRATSRLWRMGPDEAALVRGKAHYGTGQSQTCQKWLPEAAAW